jgi:hypothetical protein
MFLGTVTKQPRDRRDIILGFGKYLDRLGGDELGTITSFVEPAGLSLIGINHNGRVCHQWVEGGEDGATYQITLIATTVGGRVKDVEVRVRVRDR